MKRKRQNQNGLPLKRRKLETLHSKIITCKHEECTNKAISHGLCRRHGIKKKIVILKKFKS